MHRVMMDRVMTMMVDWVLMLVVWVRMGGTTLRTNHRTNLHLWLCDAV
jgi:hypothetical protein